MILGMLGAILIAAKILGYSSLSWFWTLSPIVAIVTIWLVYLGVVLFVEYKKTQRLLKRR